MSRTAAGTAAFKSMGAKRDAQSSSLGTSEEYEEGELESLSDESSQPAATKVQGRVAVAEDLSSDVSSSEPDVRILDRPASGMQAAPLRAGHSSVPIESTEEGEDEFETASDESPPPPVKAVARPPASVAAVAVPSTASRSVAAPPAEEESELISSVEDEEGESEGSSLSSSSTGSAKKAPAHKTAAAMGAGPPLPFASLGTNSNVDDSIEYSDDTGTLSTNLKLSGRMSSGGRLVGSPHGRAMSASSPKSRPVASPKGPPELPPDRVVAAPKKVALTPVPREIVRATGCPIEVDIEDIVAVCLCGQSNRFPYCDDSHVAYNAANNANLGPWMAERDKLGSVVMVCGCGKSARRNEARIPLCDHSCKDADGKCPAAVLATATASAAPPPQQQPQQPQEKQSVQPAVAVAVPSSPLSGRSPATTPTHAGGAPSARSRAGSLSGAAALAKQIKAEGSPRSPVPVPLAATPAMSALVGSGSPRAIGVSPRMGQSPRTVTVVDKMGDVSGTGSVATSEEGESEGDSSSSMGTGVVPFAREVVKVVAPRPPPPTTSAPALPTTTTKQDTLPPVAIAMPTSSAAADAAEAAAEAAAKQRVKDERARAHEREIAAQEARAAANAREKQLAVEAQAKQREIRGIGYDGVGGDQAQAMRAAEARRVGEEAEAREAEKAARQAEIAREEEKARRLRERREEEQRAEDARRAERDGKQERRERDERRRRVADDVAAADVRSGAVVVAAPSLSARRRDARRDMEELFASSDDDEAAAEVYLPWERAALDLSLSRSLAPEVLYCTHWDPASVTARFLIATKNVSVRVVIGAPPDGTVGGTAVDVLPVLQTCSGRAVFGCNSIAEYLIDRFRSSGGPSFVSRTPQVRSATAVLCNLSDTHLAPLLYLYPSHTLIALAGKPPVPMRSAAKEEVFRLHLQHLDTMEQFASRRGPYLTGMVLTMADAVLFPYFIFYETYFRRLRKELWVNRPKLQAWWGTMKADTTVASIVADVHKAVSSIVN